MICLRDDSGTRRRASLDALGPAGGSLEHELAEAMLENSRLRDLLAQAREQFHQMDEAFQRAESARRRLEWQLTQPRQPSAAQTEESANV